MTTKPTSWIRWELNVDMHLEGAVRSSYARYLPELMQLGYQKAAAYPLFQHVHMREYEFVYVERGSVTWELGDRFYPTSAGEWFFTYPGEQHNARFNHMEPSTIWWIILEKPAPGQPWLRLPPQEWSILVERFRGLPRIFRSTHRAREQLMRLKTTLSTEASTETGMLAWHQLLDILFGFFQPGAAKPIERDLREAIVRTVDLLTVQPERRTSVADLAEAVHLSESHYYKVFREIYGQSPIAYLDRIRMERACDLLLTDMPITDIALELGYKTSQHFTTVFKKQIGSSPSAWKAANNGQPS